MRGVAAGRSAQRACERSSDWRRGAAGSPDPKDRAHENNTEVAQRSPDPKGRADDNDQEVAQRSPDPKNAVHDNEKDNYFTSKSSTSNLSVALGGMTPPAPRAP